MDASPTSLALAEAAPAPILRCDGNDVRTAANCEPMQTNAITSENTPKHSIIEMVFIIELINDYERSGPGSAERSGTGGRQAHPAMDFVPAVARADLSNPNERR